MEKQKLHYTQIAWLLVVLAFVLAALSFLIPVASTVTDGLRAHIRTAIAIVAASLYCGAALWFWRGLSHFKTRLRVAYIVMGIGMILFGAAMLQLPVFGLFDLWKTAWATAGGAVIVFVLSTIPMYLGTRRLARLSGVTDWTTSVWRVLLIMFGLAIAGAIVSPYFIRHDMVGAPAYVGSVLAATTNFFFSALMVYKSMKALGPSYSQALRSLSLSFFVLTLVGVNEATVVTFMPRTTTFYSVYGIYIIPFVIAGLLFVRACFYFHMLTAVYSPEAETDTKAPISDKDYIDSIVNVADLASRVDQINPILDGLRQITARHMTGEPLTAKEKDELVGVYHHLETYLTKDDPLRKFTTEQLLDHVTPRFGRLLAR